MDFSAANPIRQVMKAVNFKNVRKKFNRLQVLEDISFSIDEGEFCILIGHNGVGKSTILNLIMQNQFLDSGKIEVLGRDVLPHNRFHEELAFVHEKIDFKLPMNMEKAIKIMSEGFENWDQAFFEQMVKDRKLDLGKKFSNYSRGQKMQIALMISLARRTKVILIDEITSVLDPAGQRYFLNILRNYCQQGNTVLLTTNIINEAQRYCDRVIYFDNGIVVLNENKEDLISRFIKVRVPDSMSTQVSVDNGTLVDYLRGAKDYIIDRSQFVNQYHEEDIKVFEPTLEDLFLYLYEHGAKDVAA
jgi:ABC-2 type transport system ATP-binding protein